MVEIELQIIIPISLTCIYHCITVEKWEVKPFYMLSLEKLKEAVMHGKTAFIDPRFQKRSFAESKLAEIIPLCWRYDPRQRIDIFQLVDLLRNAVEENKAHQK